MSIRFFANSPHPHIKTNKVQIGNPGDIFVCVLSESEIWLYLTISFESWKPYWTAKSKSI